MVQEKSPEIDQSCPMCRINNDYIFKNYIYIYNGNIKISLLLLKKVKTSYNQKKKYIYTFNNIDCSQCNTNYLHSQSRELLFSQ